MRHQKDGVSDEEHAAWGRDYAFQILATYRDVPVWVLAMIVPRTPYPEGMREGDTPTIFCRWPSPWRT